MQQIKLTLYLCFFLSFISYSLMLKVSFNDGNIYVPLQEARMSTHLRLKFKTNKENGLLFLAAGRTDYCLLKLKSGKIHFHYKINNTLVKLSSISRKYADMNWHDISLNRYEQNLSLQINKNFLKETLPKNTNELNIHFGINLGSIGDMSALYLENVENFRGCISDVFYNNINILKRAKEHSSHSDSGISWICNNYFSYSINDIISFTHPNSYAVISNNLDKKFTSFSFEFRTTQPNSMLVLNQGKDFMLLQISNGKIKFYGNHDSTGIENMNYDVNVANGKWHTIKLKQNSTSFYLQLDENNIEILNIPHQINSIKSDQNFYFGGLPTDFQSSKIIQEEISNNQLSNFNGCIKNIQLNELDLGFPNMSLGNEVYKDCLWNYTCLERNPCILNSECKHVNLSDFMCKCNQPFCIRDNFAEKYKIFTDDELELFEIIPLNITKGGSIFLTLDYICPSFNLSKIINTDLMFYVTASPRFGELFRYSNNNQTISNCNNFTFDDLSNSKIKYVHNAIDNHYDRITIDLIINRMSFIDLPLKNHQFRFILFINLNTADSFDDSSSENVLEIIQGIPKYLPKDFLNIPSDYRDDIKYSIICPINSSVERFGFQMDGNSVDQITQRQLNNEKITFFYISSEINEDFNLNLTIQVIENDKINYTIYKTVLIHPLKLKLINNTGLIIIYETSELITNSNLSFVIDHFEYEEDTTEIRYKVQRKPGFGFIERFKINDGAWEEINWFTNSEIDGGLIRYRSLTDKSNYDNFEFTASCGHYTSRPFEFKITLTQLVVVQKELKDFIIKGSQKGTITNFLLNYGTSPINTPPKNIIYRISKVTKYGNVYLEGYPKHAKENDSFTQHDVDRNLVKYKTHEESYSKFTDNLELMVLVDKCESLSVKFKIIYYPVKEFSDNLHYQDQKSIHLKEGDKILIKEHNFDISLIEYKNLTFNLINQPQNGYIYKLGDSLKKIMDFGSDDLISNKIYYQHDDSESEYDSFEVLILNHDSQMKFQYNLQINIKIDLVNDNPPRKKSEQRFHVERNTKRLVTLESLNYIDDDINTNTQSIYFLHVSSTNGHFLLNEKTTNRFSKNDIERKQVQFVHNGPDKGQASFIVSDGIHEIPGSLEIEASEPYILINQNNASLVKEGTYLILTKANFNIETNIDSDPRHIKFTIIEPPKYGILMYYHNNLTTASKISWNNSIEQFTQFDVDNDEIAYWNLESATVDKIRYQLQIKSVITIGHIDIRIYPAIYWEPLRIENNETLFVDESTSKPITKDVLQITHPSVSAGDIKYLVTSLPLQGYIEIQSHTEEYNNANIFDQSAINSGNVVYIHAGVNGTLDSISFDVTNGITWLKGLLLRIIIIPEHFYVNTYPVYVNEGKYAEIKPENFIPYSEYYKSRLVEYKIIEPPKYGTILMGNFEINRFSQKQLESKIIRYANDGSERIKDSISFVALARNKQSLPFTLDIFIQPVNDEQPIVSILNTFSVWRGGKYLIKNTDLLTEDNDSPPEDLKYIIDYVYGGYLVLADNSQKIHTFTQKQINDLEVFYINDLNSTENEFGFLVTDGIFSTSHHVLKILVKPITILVRQNKKLIIFPITYKPISIDELNYVCSDELRDITFIITRTAQHGTLFFKNEKKYSKNITKFTQNDILNGYVYYENTYFATGGLKMKDQFQFTAMVDNIEQLREQFFDIEVSISEGGLSKYIPIEAVHVNEGESNSINLKIENVIDYLKSSTHLNSLDLYFKSIEKPAHGIINNNNNNVIYYPINFKNQQVLYEHDNSETTDDKIIFSMYLAQGDMFLCNITVPVYITLVNDEPFELLTKSPNIKLVEGENVTITEDILCTKDNDTLPQDIIYNIISAPTIGKLVKFFGHSNGQREPKNISQFTQEDINQEKIVYIHDGLPQSTSFYFKVSDGSFSPVFEIFNITIEKIWFSLTNNQYEINLMQGYYSIVLNEPNNVFLTNVKNSLLSYNITNSPESGIILIKNQPTLHFTHKNLENKEITYMQTDVNKHEDSFQINVYPSYGSNSYGITFNAVVKIEPIFKINSIDVTSKELKKLETSILDPVTEQKYKLQNPKFLVVKKPAHGQIRKKLHLDRNYSNSDEQIESFTLKDIRNGLIYYKLSNNNLDPKILDDSIEYILQIRDAQPAKSQINIKLNEEIKVDSNRKDIFYCVLIAIIIIMIIISIIFVKTLIKHRKITMKNKHPPSLPIPPEMIGKNESDYLSRNTLRQLDGISYVPSCRVLVMDYNDEYNGQPADNCIIGQKDTDNWSSSCDMTQNSELKASQLSLEYASNPLLRRNQYWV